MIISIKKNSNGAVHYIIDSEESKTLSFNNLVLLANRCIDEKISAQNIDIKVEENCKLYEKMILEIINSVNSDIELLELLNKEEITEVKTEN